MISLHQRKLSPSFEMKRLFVFYVVSETLNFTEAAKVLSVGQSTVSHHISALEKELGINLLQRNRRAVELTPEGKKVYVYAKRIFDAFKDFEDYVTRKEKDLGEKLCVYGGENSLLTLVVESIQDFTEQYPSIKFDMVGMSTVPLFSSRDLYVRIFENINHQPDIIQDYLMTFHLGLYANKSYLKQFGEPQSIADLDRHRLIASGHHDSPFFGVGEWILSVGRPKGQNRTPYLIINTAPLTCGAVDKGLGIAIMARESCLLKQEAWVEILPEVAKPEIKAYFTYHSAHKTHPSIRAFEKHLRCVVEKRGWH